MLGTRSAGRLPLAAVVLGLFALVTGLALEARADQRRSVENVEERFHQRIDLAADYVAAHLDDMRRRQVAYAERELGGLVTATRFERATVGFGFEAAVLLDERGVVLAVAPQKASLVGTELASRYEHLSTALRGRVAVSGIVPSAADQTPVVAVAAPFDTPSGRRVISGGYQLADSPLSDFLSATSSLRGRELHLVDGAGQIIATTEGPVTGALARNAPALAEISTTARTVDHQGEPHFAVGSDVPGTDWRLVAAAPLDELLAPVQNTADTMWLLVGGLAAMACAVIVLLVWVSRQRDRMRHLSRTDALTGLANRGRADEVMARAAAVSARTRSPWAVMMIDVDHFKSVNDRLGHAGGDAVLRAVATALGRQTRNADLCARWGGEEFIVVMEGTDARDGSAAAERVAAAVRALPIADDRPVTVSIGVASDIGGTPTDLVSTADRALYDAKQDGRDRVVIAGVAPSDVPVDLDARLSV